MKSLTLTALGVVLLALLSNSGNNVTRADEPQTVEDWQNPQVLGINKLPPRVAAWPNPNAASGWKSDYDHSPWVQSLNGQWAFNWVAQPDQRPKDFYSPNYDASKWKPIAVPSTWETQGYGTPIYTNSNYPFDVSKPGVVMNVPPKKFTSFNERNPVGSYRRTFRVPASWGAGRTLLHFAGVYSAMNVWINGQKVGFSKDSRSPAEFDVTPFLKGGDNLLAVEVYKWSDGSYLEDQDMWRMSGIYRDVFLYHTPNLSLWDCYVDANLNPDYKGATLGLRYNIRDSSNGQNTGLRVRLSLRGPDGQVVNGKPLLDAPVGALTAGINEEKVIAPVVVKNPLLWSEEKPNLYDVLIELVQNGRVIETRRLDVGFRRVELRDKQYFINGQSIKIKGINRHESDPSGGYTLTREKMEKDLRLIKGANLNFVRTSHYPNDPRWYELCNRMGLFVLDEANVETHGLSYQKKVLPGDDPLWIPAVVDRVHRMAVRDRSQPCVVFWSLGNEAGYGKDFMNMREALLAVDPQKRPIQYADMNLAADVDSQTYPTVEWLHQHLAGKAVRKGEHGEIGVVEQHGPYPSGRPFLTNEYAHAQANSLGNLQDYWDVFEANPMLLGGFIWEWADQTLYKTDSATGQKFFAYGGDFGDEPNNSYFCVKGLVSGDRIPRPQYYEAKKVFQYIEVLPVDLATGQVRIRNEYAFTNLSEFVADWVLEENGLAIKKGKLAGLNIAPRQEKVVSIPLNGFEAKTGAEYFLTVTFRLAKAASWAPVGHIVAWSQLAVPGAAAQPEVAVSGQVTLAKQGNDWVASAGGNSIRVEGVHGWLSSYSLKGSELLTSPLQPNFWRAPTDNDLGWTKGSNPKQGSQWNDWKDAAKNAQLLSLDGVSTAEGARITSSWELNLGSETATTSLVYWLRGDGALRIEMKLDMGGDKNIAELPRVGVQFAVPASMQQVRWFGRGPMENYRDRKTGAAIGLYSSTINDWITPYVRPQENSNRTDIRWLSLTNVTGSGFKAQSQGQPFGVTAWPYTLDDLQTAKHDYQLPRRDSITICLDGFQIGVGGDTSWGLPVHDEYRLKDKGIYQFAIELGPAKQ